MIWDTSYAMIEFVGGTQKVKNDLLYVQFER